VNPKKPKYLSTRKGDSKDQNRIQFPSIPPDKACSFGVGEVVCLFGFVFLLLLGV
jgi:hypothetical protein